ncbi:MAG: hypothetical protein LW629_06445 [Burkholderiales bacterium]|jgi:hypothetical protein|nr:hypothetical protein [Burkholderiales bacterium]
MKSLTRVVSTVALLSLSVVTTACMKPEMEQSKKGFYAGKPDISPHESASTEYKFGNWKQGDKASWESAMRSRSLNQNEYNKAPGKEATAAKN